MKDIAHQAGVSLATVSRALGNNTRITKETRERVLKIAQEIGYRPDPVMQVLIERRWHGRRSDEGMNVGFVWDSQSTIATTARQEFKHFREHGHRAGYNLIAEDLRAHRDARQLIKRLEAKGCMALVISMMPDVPYDISILSEHFAAVSIGVSSWQPNCPIIMHDEFQGVDLTWKQLEHMGYRRFGVMLHNYPESYTVDQRYGTVFYRQRFIHAEEDYIPVYIYDSENAFCEEEIGAWIRRYKPEVVVGDSHYNLFSLQALGFDIPKDFAFATLNLWDRAEVGKIAGCFRDNLILFERGLQLLNLMTRCGACGASQGDLAEMVKGSWKDGATLPKK